LRPATLAQAGSAAQDPSQLANNTHFDTRPFTRKDRLFVLSAWAQMGLFETYRMGGGDAGMRHFLEQFGPALQWPWTKLMDVPNLDRALISKIAEQVEAQTGKKTVAEMMEERDRNLVAIMKALGRTPS